MIMYALHDAVVEAHARAAQGAQPGRVLDDGRATGWYTSFVLRKGVALSTNGRAR